MAADLLWLTVSMVEIWENGNSLLKRTGLIS